MDVEDFVDLFEIFVDCVLLIVVGVKFVILVVGFFFGGI